MFLVICSLHFAPVTSQYVNVIAHQVNTPDAIRWALGQGANGIEIDLNFDGTFPVYFHHGKPCDCSCMLNPSSDNGCAALLHACTATTSCTEMMIFLGSKEIVGSSLALIYIDAKLDKSMRDYAEAGANVVRMLNENVLSRGYRGQVLLGCYTVSKSDYLRGALREAAKSSYADRYFYTIDVQGKRSDEVWQESLQLGTNNIVYATGISACAPFTYYYDAIRKSLEKMSYAAVGIWTVDKESAMARYLEIGVNFILTNRPNVAVNLIGRNYIPLPGQAFIAKLVPRPTAGSLYWECDCSYYYRFPRGGCAITKTAPPHHACRCSYKGTLSCAGETVTCRDANNYLCRTPKSTEEACLFGGGNCKGYF